MGKTISYIWTARDQTDLAGQTKPVAGITPYGFSPRQIKGAPRVGDQVKLALPGHEQIWRTNRFLALDVPWVEIEWKAIGAHATKPNVKKATKLADLLDALHELNPKLYPASFYAISRENGRETSDHYPLILKSRHIAVVFDHWLNSKWRADYIASGDFDWDEYWPGKEQKNWKGIFNLRVPDDKSTLFVPRRRPKKRRTSASPNAATSVDSSSSAKELVKWHKNVRALIDNIEVEIGNFSTEVTRTLHPYAILDMYQSSIELERGLMHSTDPTAAENVARACIDAAMAKLDEWSLSPKADSADQRITRKVGLLEGALTNNAVAADAMVTYLAANTSYTRLTNAVIGTAAQAFDVLAMLPNLASIDPEPLMQRAVESAAAAKSGNPPLLEAEHGGSPLYVLMSFRYREMWDKAKALAKPFATYAKMVRRVSLMATSAAAYRAASGFKKALALLDPTAGDALHIDSAKWNAALPYNRKIANSAAHWWDEPANAAATKTQRFLYLEKMDDSSFLVASVKHLEDATLYDAKELLKHAERVNSPYLAKYSAEVDRLEDLHDLILKSTGVGVTPEQAKQARKAIGFKYKSELKSLAQKGSSKAPRIKWFSRAETLLFYVGTGCSMIANFYQAGVEWDDDDPFLQIIGGVRYAKAGTEALQVLHKIGGERVLNLFNKMAAHPLRRAPFRSGIGGLGSKTWRCIPAASYVAGGVLDLTQSFYAFKEKDYAKGVLLLGSALGGGLSGYALLPTAAAWCGPAGLVVTIVASAGVVAVDVYESQFLKEYSEGLSKSLVDPSTDGGFWYKQYASAALEADFDAIHAAMSRIPKGINNEDNVRLLKITGVSDGLWHHLLDGYPAPGGKRPDTTTPAKDRGVTYWKTHGEWNY